MRAIPKAPSWEETLKKMQSEIVLLSPDERPEMQRKITALQKAMAIRDGLMTPGKMEFSL